MDRSYGWHVFLLLFSFQDFFWRVYKINKIRGIPGYKKTQVLNHPVAYGSTMGTSYLKKRIWDGLCPPKKMKDPKNLWKALHCLENLKSSTVRTWKFLIWFRFQMMFLFNLWGWCALCSFLSKLYLKQPCINLWFDMTRLVLNFGSDYRYTLVSDVIKLFWHKIPGRHWWKTTRCTKTQRLPTEFCGILAGIGFCHARDFAWESHHFLGEGCVCRYLNRVFYMMSTW